MGAITLNREQYDALGRLFSSLGSPTSVSGVKLGTLVVSHGPFTSQKFLTVEFLSGFGNRGFHVDQDGNSAPVDRNDDSMSDLIRHLV